MLVNSSFSKFLNDNNDIKLNDWSLKLYQWIKASASVVNLLGQIIAVIIITIVVVDVVIIIIIVYYIIQNCINYFGVLIFL